MVNWFCIFLMMTGFNPLFAKTEEAIFAGGGFWSLQADFDNLNGVLDTTTGFDGGSSKNPDYAAVSAGNTGYAESVRVIFNPDVISYSQLLDFFWRHIDPTTREAQFCNNGQQYRTAIFYLNARQKKLALISRHNLEKKFPVIATEIVSSTQFHAAEGYHQKYYLNNPLRYKFYRYQCGRDKRLREVWKNEAF